jgi:hypothetical protein
VNPLLPASEGTIVRKRFCFAAAAAVVAVGAMLAGTGSTASAGTSWDRSPVANGTSWDAISLDPASDVAIDHSRGTTWD